MQQGMCSGALLPTENLQQSDYAHATQKISAEIAFFTTVVCRHSLVESSYGLKHRTGGYATIARQLAERADTHSGMVEDHWHRDSDGSFQFPNIHMRLHRPPGAFQHQAMLVRIEDRGPDRSGPFLRSPLCALYWNAAPYWELRHTHAPPPHPHCPRHEVEGQANSRGPQ